MHILQRIRNNPIAVLCLLTGAFFMWIVMDLMPANNTLRVDSKSSIGMLKKLTKNTTPSNDTMPPAHSAPVQVGVLQQLKPGMTRIEVEQLLGPPAPDQLQPVTQTNGSLTYCTAYELIDSQPPMTIRPIQPKAPRISDKPTEPKSHVTLEYDASKPGHPLIEVHYPDPLF